jgi:hypothetical protein
MWAGSGKWGPLSCGLAQDSSSNITRNDRGNYSAIYFDGNTLRTPSRGIDTSWNTVAEQSSRLDLALNLRRGASHPWGVPSAFLLHCRHLLP